MSEKHALGRELREPKEPIGIQSGNKILRYNIVICYIYITYIYIYVDMYVHDINLKLS